MARHAGGGAPDHAAYKSAFEAAILYNIACYVVVALSTLLLKSPPLAHGGRTAGPPMVE
jgi:hypothetical protein